MFLSPENPHLLEDNILFLILIGKRNFHTYLITDSEANRCRIVFKNLISNHPGENCHEAYFGLAKIYFHLNRLDVAFDCIHKACKIRPHDQIYMLWKGLILFYIVSFGSLASAEHPEDMPILKNQLNDCYQALNQALVLSKNSSLASLYMLVKLCAYAEKYEAKYSSIKLKKKAKDFAIKMQDLEPYMG